MGLLIRVLYRSVLNSKTMTNLDLIPPAFRENPSARRIIMSTYEKAHREQRWGGYWSNELCEMIGATPDTKKIEYAGDINYKLEFADADYLADPY